MAFSPLIEEFIQALRCLPGVGPKTAQRMAFHLLQRDRDNGRYLARVIENALNNIKHCSQCRTLCESKLCQICANEKRDSQFLCIVESPVDMLAIEQTSMFKGKYFVLLGHLSPLDGIGPDDIGIEQLKIRLSHEHFNEIILATNPTVEGEATAHYLTSLIKPFSIKVTRIAHGVPIGGELEYIDGNTLSRALTSREVIL